MSIEPVRFEDVGERRFAGLRRTFTFDGASAGIGPLWGEFSAKGPVPGFIGMRAFGIMVKADQKAGTLDYMTAAEVSEFTDEHEGFDALVLPSARYAVFWHGGHVTKSRPVWDAIFGQWLPSSGYVHGHSPELESYDERFDPATGEGGFEIWIPVSNKD